MKFRMENVGKVREAEIMLGGISVIAGPNACGKSTISRGLYLATKINSYLWIYLLHEKARSIITSFFKVDQNSNKVPLNAYFPFSPRLLSLFSGSEFVENSNLLVTKEFWQNTSSVYDYFLSYCNSGQTGVTKDDGMYHKFMSEYTKIIPKICSFIDGQNQDKYMMRVVDRLFKRGFKNQVNSFCTQETASFVLNDNTGKRIQRFDFKDGSLDVFAIDSINKLSPFYLDTLHMIDSLDWINEVNFSLRDGYRNPLLRYDDASDVGWNEYIRYAKNMNPTPEETMIHSRTLGLLKNVTSLLGGKIGIEKNLVVFKDEISKVSIKIGNLASGMKSMAMITRAIENGWIKENDLLIIDEPESNLHPEWQVRFAEFLVSLAKYLNLKLLLNVHSPYFLMAVKKYVIEADILNRFNAYHMVQNEDSSMFTAKDVGTDLNEIYEAMAKPFDTIRFG